MALAMDVPLLAGFVIQGLYGRDPDDATNAVKICVAVTDFMTTLLPLFVIATSSLLTKKQLKKRRARQHLQSFSDANQCTIESIGYHVTIMFVICEAPLRLLHALVDLYSYFCHGGFEEEKVPGFLMTISSVLNCFFLLSNCCNFLVYYFSFNMVNIMKKVSNMIQGRRIKIQVELVS